MKEDGREGDRRVEGGVGTTYSNQ